MLPCMECWTTSREEFLKVLLVKVDDQGFDGDGFSTLIVALLHHLLIAEEDSIPQWSRHLVFYWLCRKTYKKLRSKITNNFF